MYSENSNQRRCQRAERMRKRGALRDGSHRNPQSHADANDGAQPQSGRDPFVGDDFVMEESADDGEQHSRFRQKHAFARMFGRTQPL